MSFIIGFRRTLVTCSAVITLLCTVVVHATMEPRFELDAQTLDGSKPTLKLSQKNEKRASRVRIDKPIEGDGSRETIYVVRQGDNLFKILMREYGCTNDEAEVFIGEIRRKNNMYDIRRLKIGQKIVIPPVDRKVDKMLKFAKSVKGTSGLSAPVDNYPVTAGQAFRLESPVAAAKTYQETTTAVEAVWAKMIPSKGELQKPITLQSPAFSLTLDPKRYPVFKTMDGGTILLDQNATIPPLVKSLIEEKDHTVRIVSESPANGRRFLSAMLGAAGFYSVEENFNMEFGTDPKLVVHSDFKIEKTSESLINQDVILLNSRETSFPQSLDEFLKKEGFTVYELFASLKPLTLRTPSRQIHQITAKGQPEILDAILKALEVSYQTDRNIDVFAADNNGISLSVKAERFFERGGQRFVVTSFDGDPVTYTLFRILETRGYRVVILEAKDDFRKITEKILSRLRIQGGYAQHKLWSDDATNYSLQMSGFNLEGAGIPDGSLFLTNLPLDRIILDLLKENGYNVHVK
ncbi:MAG: LysM domain-containing protein [Pedobacter sp.]